MKIAGSITLPHPVAPVWDAILDPAVLVVAIPGCSRLEEVAPHSYAMTVTAGVASIRGTYDGSAVLSDLDPGRSLRMRLTGAGGPGTIEATVLVAFREVDGGTEVSYDADAVVGGMVGGVGQRMLASVSRRMAAEFFTRVGESLSGEPAAAPAGAGPATPGRSPMPERYVDAPGVVPPGVVLPGVVPPGGVPSGGGVFGGTPQAGVFYPPAAPAARRDDFRAGLAVGAGLVLLGVVAGRLLGRGR